MNTSPGSSLQRISIIGGAGHVGLPLALVLVREGFDVDVIDIDQEKIAALKEGHFPFLEQGGQELLSQLQNNSRLRFHSDFAPVSDSQAIVVVVGTPVDEHLNPKLSPIFQVLEQIRPFLRKGQVLILRSTLFPGTSEKIAALLEQEKLEVGVAFCPERIAQGKALDECGVYKMFSHS